MAVVTSPGMGTSARKKLAGVVFSSWRGVQYMRSLRTPNNPNTPGQQAARRKFACAALAWKFIHPLLKGYFDQLAKLHCPLMDDSGPLLQGISGTYTGYNLHRYAYIHGIVPLYGAAPSGFAYDEGANLFTFVANVGTVPVGEQAAQGRVWYSVKPFGVWTRGTASINWGLTTAPIFTILSPVGCFPGMTGDDISLMFDAYVMGKPGNRVVAGSSLPDGRIAAVPGTAPTTPPLTPDPCLPPS